MTDLNTDQEPVAVVCAMNKELDHLRVLLPPQHEAWHEGRGYWVTALQHSPVILTCCGVGMANAAAATEALITRYHPRAVLNYGCSGSHRLDVLPGDLVIGSRVVLPDRVTVEADGSERYMGMWYLHHGIPKKVESLSCSSSLLELATRTAALLEGSYEAWPLAAGWPSSVPHRTPQALVGTIATSDRWNRAPHRISQIVAQHDSVCEDMEAAAIALICASHEGPFLAVKDISNNELLRSTNEGFLTETAGQLGRRAATFTFALLLEFCLSPQMISACEDVAKQE
jgi:adenosylhomocysteine nucleosidase